MNALLALGVAAIVVVLVGSAVARDSSGSSLANATRPNLSPGPTVTATSTTLAGDLFTAGAAADNPVAVFGPSSTTTTTVAVARTVPTPSTRAAARPTTTVARAPGTTVPTSEVIFTDVPTTTLTAAPTTTTPVTVPPVTTTAPPATTSTTAPPATTSTTAPRIALPPLLG